MFQQLEQKVLLAGLSKSTLYNTADIEPLHQIERKAIEQALNQCEGSVNKAAAILEVNPSTLYRKIKEYDIN